MATRLRDLTDLAFVDASPGTFLRLPHYLARCGERRFNDRLLRLVVHDGVREWSPCGDRLVCEATVPGDGRWRVVLEEGEGGLAARSWLVVTVVYLGDGRGGRAAARVA